MSYEITEVVVDENNEPLVMADGTILCHVIDDNGDRDTIGLQPEVVHAVMGLRSPATGELDPPSSAEDEKNSEWSEEQTRFILDKYYEYLAEVGPMKKFRLKKDMWSHISKEVNEKFNSCKTATQIENRYKTIMKRKKKAIDNNQKTGAKRMKIDYEDELKKISSIDDSIAPEVLQDQNVSQVKESSCSTKEKAIIKKSETVASLLKKINEEKKLQREKHHQEREENKERRHREKLEMLKELFKNI